MVRKELSSLYSVEWRHKGDDPDAKALLDHHYHIWSRNDGIFQHSPDVQQLALSLAPKLREQGLISDLHQWFLFLHHLDVLCSQTAWLVVHMVALKRLPVDAYLENHDLKSPTAGSLMSSLAWVPACSAVMAYNHLTRKVPDWLSNDPHVVAALEAVQLLTGTATRNRKKNYSLTLKGLSKLVSDFGQLSPGLLKPGPWVSPELGGARFPATDDVLLLLEQGKGIEDTLTSYLMLDHPAPEDLQCPANETRFVALGKTEGNLIPEVISQADPAAILVALLEQELNRRESKPLSAICLVPDGWLDDMLQEQEDLPPAAKRRWLEDWAGRMDHHESEWRRATDVFNQARRGFRPLVITANRPEPQWQTEASQAVSGLDQYWADIAEVNPRQSRCLAVAGIDSVKVLPQSTELLRNGGLSKAHLIDAEHGRSALAAVLANQNGLNLMVISPQQALDMKPLLNQALSFTDAQTLDDDPAPWLGLPVVIQYGQSERLSMAEDLLKEDTALVKVVLPPDANTAMAALKAVYGIPGVITLICLPAVDIPVISPEQAEQLAHHGSVCLAGNCAADLQIVACGGLSLRKAYELSLYLYNCGASHSLVYVSDAAQLRADESSLSALLPSSVQRRLLITDLTCVESLSFDGRIVPVNNYDNDFRDWLVTG